MKSGGFSLIPCKRCAEARNAGLQTAVRRSLRLLGRMIFAILRKRCAEARNTGLQTAVRRSLRLLGRMVSAILRKRCAEATR